jgi:hypothetical protein
MKWIFVLIMFYDAEVWLTEGPALIVVTEFETRCLINNQS